MKRKNGYYWVKYNKQWIIAKYYANKHWDIGISINEGEFDEIDERQIVREPYKEQEIAKLKKDDVSNGIIGHGCRSWKTSDSRSCNDCGVIFKPVKGNGL